MNWNIATFYSCRVIQQRPRVVIWWNYNSVCFEMCAPEEIRCIQDIRTVKCMEAHFRLTK